MCRIYLVTNKTNNKQYVGQTVTKHSRHGHGHALRDAYKKYGFNNFTYETILSNIQEDNLQDYAERFWIKVVGSLAPNGYNLEEGGKRGKRVHHKPNLGKKASDETRAKMTASQKKHWASYEVHPNVGRKPSEETRRKMSESKKNQVQTMETKMKRSESIKLWHQMRKEQACQPQ